MKVTIKEYREKTPLGTFWDHSISGYLGSLLSPYISILCMKYNLKPNTITLLMLLSGIIGGVVLMTPNVYCKFISAFIYLLWFTFDCSDGEVARYTQTFSRGGTLLDWCAHLVTHSLFIVAMWFSFVQYYDNNLRNYITLLSFLFLIAELLHRNRVSMDRIFNNGDNTNINLRSMSKIKFIYFQFIYMPNLLFLFPLFLALDIWLEVFEFSYIYIIWALFYSLAMIREFIGLIQRLYIS